MSAAVLTLVIISICAFGSVSCHNDNLLQTLLSSLERLVNFYQNAYKGMNLDGIFGLRTLEGQLDMVLDDIASGKTRGLDSRVTNHLRSLHEVAASVSNMSLAYLKDLEPDYFNRMRPLVERSFRFGKPYRQVKLHLRWKESDLKPSNSGFDEDFSDGCMAELMGSDGHKKCEISAPCLHTMSSPGYEGYFITHQLLYTILAEQSGCLDDLNQQLLDNGRSGVQGLQEELCTNNFLEVARVIQDLKGNLIPRAQDLFMEQAMVCPALGFMEFLHADWITQIMAWQKPNGCYGKMAKSDLAKFQPNNRDYEYEEQDANKEKNVRIGLDERNIPARDYDPNRSPKQEQNRLRNIQNDKPGMAGQTRTNDRRLSNIQRNVDSVNFANQQGVIVQQPNGNLHAIGSNNTQYKPQLEKATQKATNKQANQVVVNNRQYQLVNNELNTKQGGMNQNNQGAIGKKPNTRDQAGLRKLPQNTGQNLQFVQRRELNAISNKNEQERRTAINGPVQEKATMGGEKHAGLGQPGVVLKGDGISEQNYNRHKPLNSEKISDNNNESERVPGLLPGPTVPRRDVVRQVRRLLFEKDMSDGCLSHKTAVAAGALSQYLRFLLDPGPPEYQAVVRMTGTNLLMTVDHFFAPEEGAHVQRPAGADVDMHFQENHVLRKPNIPDHLQMLEKRHADIVADDDDDDDDSDEIVGPKDDLHLLESEGDVDNAEERIVAGGNDYADHQENPPQDYYKDQINFNNQEDNQSKRGSEMKTENRNMLLGDKDKADYVDDDYNEDDVKEDEVKKELHEAGLDAGDKEYEQYIDNDENGFNNVNKDSDGNDEEYDEDEGPRQAEIQQVQKHIPSTRAPNIGIIKTENEIKQIMKEDAYNYYDNGGHHFQKGTGHLSGENNDIHVNMGHRFDLSNSLGKTYLFLLLSMLILLFFMYRFIRRRRVLIKYRYR